MIAFICLFFPAVVSVWLFEHLSKSELTRKKWLYRYCTNVVFINLLCFLIKRVFLGTAGSSLYDTSDMTPAAALNYLVMSIVFAVGIAFISVLASKHAKLEVEDDSNDQR